MVANVALAKTKGAGGGFLLVNFGWGLAVFAGVYVAYRSGAHLNPAVTLGLLANGADEYAPGVDVTSRPRSSTSPASCSARSSAPSLPGSPTGSTSTQTEDPGAQLAVFSTGPAIRNPVWNMITEVIGTFVLVFVILMFGEHPDRPRPVGGRPARRRHRRLARWAHRLRDQPGP